MTTMDLVRRQPPPALFSKGRLSEYLDAQRQALAKEIDTLPANAIIDTNIDEFITYATQKYGRTTPVLREADITVDQNEAKIDVSGDPRYMATHIFPGRPNIITGTTINYYVPFDGDPELFGYQPTSHNLGPPEGQINGNTLIIAYNDTHHDDQALKTQFQHDIGSIKSWLAWVQNDVSQYNQTIPGIARQRFEQRREKLTKDRSVVNNLGYPLRRRAGAPNTYTVPLVRKTIPFPAATPQQAEPLPITDTTYEDIITIIQNMATVLERSPHAFKDMKEEDLRTHFLVQLNGQYGGEATGETFNTTGKTDILIRHQNKNLFIAECKFWNGPTSLTDAISQLLGYTQWRDTKTAILLFNRNKNLTNVLQQIPGIVEQHPTFVRRDTTYKHETGYRCTMRQKTDDQRYLTLTILAFDIPT